MHDEFLHCELQLGLELLSLMDKKNQPKGQKNSPFSL
jgi:hypothetical protein